MNLTFRYTETTLKLQVFHRSFAPTHGTRRHKTSQDTFSFPSKFRRKPNSVGKVVPDEHDNGLILALKDFITGLFVKPYGHVIASLLDPGGRFHP